MNNFDANDFKAPEQINGWRTIALGVGGIFTLIWAIGLYLDPEPALRSWLLGFIFWGGIGIGGIGILLLQYLTGGAWGIVIRRIAEACSRTLPVIAILFLPILFGVTTMYEWTHPGNDPILLEKEPYLNVTFWAIRAVIYFVLWGVMVYLLNMWSAQQDRSANYEESAEWLGRATAFSGPTIIFYVLIVTFASVDWMMSLDPHWFSTIWGLLFVAGWALSCFAFSIVMLSWLSDKPPMNRVLGKRHFHDIGKLILALVMVWAYFNFSQYLIIWSGNLPEETTWYVTRVTGTWGYLSLFMLVFHFVFPFLLLLSRDLKRNAKYLAMLAIFILFMRQLDMFYIIAPSPSMASHGEALGFHVNWTDIVAPIAVGGIWLWAFFSQLMQRPLVPIKDPFFEKAIEHGTGH